VVPQSIFRHQLDSQLAKHVRPPTRRDLGKKVRTLKPFSTTAEVIQEQLSVAKGLPPEDEASGIMRVTPGGDRGEAGQGDELGLDLQGQAAAARPQPQVHAARGAGPEARLGAARLADVDSHMALETKARKAKDLVHGRGHKRHREHLAPMLKIPPIDISADILHLIFIHLFVMFLEATTLVYFIEFDED
jgi:hypothetical protein